VNPIVAFVGSGVMARCIYSIFKVELDGRRTSLQAGIHQTLFASWLSPINASLAFAITFVLFWYGILYVLYKKNIILKV
jgi:predicted acyltransferase